MMSDLLDRTIEEPSVEQRAQGRGTGPPRDVPEIERSTRSHWPRSAVFAVAALGLLAVIGTFGTAVQYFGDDTNDDQVAQLTDENAELRSENADLVDAVAQLEADQAELAAELTATSAEVATVTAQNVDLVDQVGDLEVDLDALTAERDALLAKFPMSVDSSLVGVDVNGDYSVEWFPVYNDGLGNIGVTNVSQVSISSTSEGWLQVTVPGVVNADLSRTDGALFTMLDATTVVPPVDGMARVARVAITIYAGATTTDLDGTTRVTELGMSVAISTPATEGAPAGVALYGAELTPRN